MGATRPSSSTEAERRRYEAAVVAHAWEHVDSDSDAFQIVGMALVRSEESPSTVLRVQWISFGESFSHDELLYGVDGQPLGEPHYVAADMLLAIAGG